jgi:hypothetical protein
VSLLVPLTVRLSTGRTDRHVTLDAADLTFRSVVPGGFASCTVPLHRPLSLQPDEVAYYGRLYVYDARNGSTVWEGRLEDPTRTAGADGEVWELSAVGPSAHTQDRSQPLIYVDQSLDRWTRGVSSIGQVDLQETGNHVTVIQHLFRRGSVVPVNALLDAVYRYLTDAGQKLARVEYTWDAGVTDTNFTIRVFAGSNLARADGANVAGATNLAVTVVTDWPSDGSSDVTIRFQHLVLGTVGNDDTWARFGTPLRIRAMQLNKDGTDKTTGYTSVTVLASDVVADLLGRVLTSYDGAGATIATSTHAIDQLAYPDSVTAAKVLEDLLGFEPDYYWAAWESGTSGKYRFEYIPWPTTVRYEASIEDGFSSPGSAEGLYNEARVRWTDIDKAIRTTVRTQTVPELDTAGLVRTLEVDLGDELGSLANAQRRGDQDLAQHRYAPNAGTLTISRPTLDLTKGRMVMPWEIRPGHLIRVRGVLPRVDALNPTARDGVTTFRVVAVDFRASDASVSLELDSHPFTLPRQIAAVAKAVPRRR